MRVRFNINYEDSKFPFFPFIRYILGEEKERKITLSRKKYLIETLLVKCG